MTLTRTACNIRSNNNENALSPINGGRAFHLPLKFSWSRRHFTREFKLAALQRLQNIDLSRRAGASREINADALHQSSHLARETGM